MWRISEEFERRVLCLNARPRSTRCWGFRGTVSIIYGVRIKGGSHWAGQNAIQFSMHNSSTRRNSRSLLLTKFHFRTSTLVTGGRLVDFMGRAGLTWFSLVLWRIGEIF